MTKMFKRFAAALTAAILVAGLADAPAKAIHDDLLIVIPDVGVIGAGTTYSNDGGSTWTATWQQYVAGEGDAAGDNGDGPLAGTFRRRAAAVYSNDGGSTWTATGRQYIAGEHDAAGDNDDGPLAGTFRFGYEGRYSNDGGSTWGAQHHEYMAGEADATGDNGDGPNAGTFRFTDRAYEFSNDGGSTWTATAQQYSDGETGETDGPNAGQARRRINPSETSALYLCGSSARPVRGGTWAMLGSFESPPNRPCLAQSPRSSRTFTWNVDDGIEPPGDWCVSGRTPADISMICRGEGYTYREARIELMFGRGRP